MRRLSIPSLRFVWIRFPRESSRLRNYPPALSPSAFRDLPAARVKQSLARSAGENLPIAALGRPSVNDRVTRESIWRTGPVALSFRRRAVISCDGQRVLKTSV